MKEINDNFKNALNVLQNHLVKSTESDNVLFIFDNEEQKQKYKKYLRQNKLCEIDKILITINDLLYTNSLIGLRYKRYWFMTDDDMKKLERL